MTGPTWPMQCAGCNKQQQDSESAFHVYKCKGEQEHAFVTCSAECERTFEKRVSKVSDAIERMERDVENRGKMNALRRLPPAEAEKIRNRNQASARGWLICPAEVKVSDKCVPFCSFCLTKVGGRGTLVQDSEALPKPPRSPARPAAGSGHAELITDDTLLEEIRRDDDDEADAHKKPRAKPVKPRKEKKMIPLGLDPSALDQDGEGDARMNGDERTQRAILQRELVLNLVRNGCDRRDAEESSLGLLERSRWDVTEAFDLWMETRVGDFGPSQTTAQQSAAVAASASAMPQEAPQREDQPPSVPPGWQAVWDRAENAFYFWCKSTGEVTWEHPAGPTGLTVAEDAAATRRQEEEARAAAARDAAAAEAAAEEKRRAAEREAAERRQQEEERRREEERRAAEARERAAREAEERRAAEAKASVVKNLHDITGAAQEHCRAVLEAVQWKLEAAIPIITKEEEQRKAQAAVEAEEARRKQQIQQHGEGPPWVRVCTRHWFAVGDAQASVMPSVHHGDRLEVSWFDEAGRWAYASLVDDRQKVGYVAADILARVEREPLQRRVGEVVAIAEQFTAPTDELGYLSVAIRDQVQVVSMPHPHVWAFVCRKGASEEAGWVPECVLGATVEGAPEM